MGHVENVVDDLKGEAGAFAEGAKAGEDVGVVRGIRIPPIRRIAYGWGTRICGEAKEAAADDAGGDESAGFGAVDLLDEFGGGLVVFRLDINDLAADHAGRDG